MKAFLRKIVSVLMAVVVLFSTMSFTIDMHFCGDTLVATSVVKKAETCGMEKQNSSNQDCTVTKKDCCRNEQTVVKGQNQLELPTYKVVFHKQLLAVAFVYAYTTVFKELQNKVILFKNYIPPLVVKDIHVLDETYLI
ncbi:hypothetical protein [Tenacibaculum sp. UWU-22]|uniref:HYC_CC_PP family protein n=1 Tax=Tenacibaculum sp. UWU-22 TaxID=3234187 RepID=UPI0034DAEB96